MQIFKLSTKCNGIKNETVIGHYVSSNKALEVASEKDGTGALSFHSVEKNRLFGTTDNYLYFIIEIIDVTE